MPSIPLPPRLKAFTLIELLIVVAIIAILAAIAVPNFLEAQVRSKVTKIKADMRTMATGLEAYQVDNNVYPFDGANYNLSKGPTRYNYWYIPYHMSTPVAYLSTIAFVDPFRKQVDTTAGIQFNNLRYMYIDSTYGPKYASLKTNDLSEYNDAYRANFGAWRINGAGPDGTYGPAGWPGLQGYSLPLPYDPSNGTVSDGDIIRSQINPQGGGNFGT